LFRVPQEGLVVAALSIIGNITGAGDPHTQIFIDCKMLPFLFNLLLSAQEPIKEKACFVIANIAGGNQEQIQVRMF